MTRTARRCGECGQKAVVPTTLPIYTETMVHDGKTYEVSVENLLVGQCENCKEILLDDAATERLSYALREKANLLSPAEIRSRRESLQLTQGELARLLRISESTLCRWETGSQIQKPSSDLALRLFFELEEVRAFCEFQFLPRPEIQVAARSG